MPRTCTVRNCFHVGPVRRGAGSIPASCGICHTVEAAMGWPSLTSSPCTLWGSEIRFGVSCGQSGGDVVFVSESAEDLLPADPVLGEVDWFGRPGAGLRRSELAKSTVRPGSVVMPQVLGQHPSQVVLIDDQHPAEDLPAQGADHPFADRVAPHGQLHLIRSIGTGVSG